MTTYFVRIDLDIEGHGTAVCGGVRVLDVPFVSEYCISAGPLLGWVSLVCSISANIDAPYFVRLVMGFATFQISPKSVVFLGSMN